METLNYTCSHCGGKGEAKDIETIAERNKLCEICHLLPEGKRARKSSDKPKRKKSIPFKTPTGSLRREIGKNKKPKKTLPIYKCTNPECGEYHTYISWNKKCDECETGNVVFHKKSSATNRNDLWREVHKLNKII